ncbi:MAG: hypothetical protein IJK19_06315 [Bacteroidales bacterium]|nr:hypothetical protein [Bacteroidales bacterium]
MKTRLLASPWTKPQLTRETAEAIELLHDDVWKEASVLFAAERDAKLRSGQSAPKGMQRYLNDVITKRFTSKGWIGEAGYFFKEKTWVRVTFRHQMSLGADILDAIKVCKKEGMQQAVILAANRKTLNLVTPNDAAAIVSFEKLEREIMSLNGALDIPLLFGELTPLSSASSDINEELKKARPRDISVPQHKRKLTL